LQAQSSPYYLHSRLLVGGVAMSSTTWHQSPAHNTATLQWRRVGKSTCLSVYQKTTQLLQMKTTAQ